MKQNEALDLYLEYLEKQRNFSLHTISSYKKDIELFAEYCRNDNVSFFSCDRVTIRNYLEHEKRRGLAKTTLKRRIVALRRYFDFLVRKDIISMNPFINIATPKIDKKLPEIMYDKEVNKLLELNGKRKDFFVLRDQAIIELLYQTGIRVSELISIKVLDINLKFGKSFSVYGKGKKQRKVLLSPSCREAIDKYVKECRSKLVQLKTSNHKNYLFLNNKGNPLTTRGVEYILSKIEHDLGLGLDLHPHKFRHTFATKMLDGGANLRTIQKMLGHNNLATTQIYTHVSSTRIKEDYQKYFKHNKKEESE